MTAAEYNLCVDQFSDGVFRFILKNLRDRERAQDVVQETFEKLWMKVNTVPFEKAKSYLFTAAYHTMIDFIRKDKRMETGHDLSKKQTGAYQMTAPDLKKLLEDALNRLPEIQRSVILLRDYEGYAYDEIGEITGLNESQVKVYIYRARLAMKQFIGSLDAVL
jgi:RNA polymerase sigma-70 factor (ECF subfamily)